MIVVYLHSSGIVIAPDLQRVFERHEWSNSVSVCSEAVLTTFLIERTVGSLYLATYRFASHTNFFVDEKHSTSVADLARVVCAIASKCKHTSVNSLHFIHAMLDLDPIGSNNILGRFQELELRMNPMGSPRLQRLWRFADEQGEESWLDDVEQRIRETRFSVPGIRTDILTYLGSGYYPYGQSEFERFRAERHETSERVDILRAFAAHLMYNESTQ